MRSNWHAAGDEGTRIAAATARTDGLSELSARQDGSSRIEERFRGTAEAGVVPRAGVKVAAARLPGELRIT